MKSFLEYIDVYTVLVSPIVSEQICFIVDLTEFIKLHKRAIYYSSCYRLSPPRYTDSSLWEGFRLLARTLLDHLQHDL